MLKVVGGTVLRRSRSLRESGEHALGDAVRRRRGNTNPNSTPRRRSRTKQPTNPRQAKKPKATKEHKHTSPKETPPSPESGGAGGDGSEGDLGRRGAPTGRGAHAEHRAEPRPRPNRSQPLKGRGHFPIFYRGRAHPPPDSDRRERRGG